MRKLYNILFVLISINTLAQTRPVCSSDEVNSFLRATNKSENKKGDLKIINGVIGIQVVFHVIYKDSAENISLAQIQSQIEVLNEDFRKKNSDTGIVRTIFSGLAADAEFEFCLATQDPNGNPTSGVTRDTTTLPGFLTFQNTMMYDSTGGVNTWPTDKYLNIWICDLYDQISLIESTGYAIFPWNKTPTTDGVVLNYKNVGRGPEVISTYYNLGRICTHEVGHWLGLYHNFQDGCPNTNCLTQGDNICDTPPQEQAAYGCDIDTLNSCGGILAMYEDYMDYTDDKCRVMFTKDQVARMKFYLTTSRSSFLTSYGCALSIGISNYPPSTDLFKIYSDRQGETIFIENDLNINVGLEIYSILGIKIFNASNITKGSSQINVKGIKYGVYFARVSSNEKLLKSEKILIGQ